MKRRSVDVALAVCAAAIPSACTSSSSPAGGPVVDDAAFMLSVQTYRDSGDFAEITDKGYPSAVASGAAIRVWLSAFAATPYRVVDPDVAGSGVRLPEGSLIIREVYDGAGALKKLTLMGKGARGYNPAVGDYWFGVTAPDGTPQVENGAELTGKLEQCFGCHQARGEVDDFLFGVPAAARPGTDPQPQPDPEPSPPPPVDPGPVCGDFACEAPESCDLCPSDCCYVPPPDDDDHGGGDD